MSLGAGENAMTLGLRILDDQQRNNNFNSVCLDKEVFTKTKIKIKKPLLL